MITTEVFEISADVEAAIKTTLGNDVAIADWEALKRLFSTQRQLTRFIKQVGIPQQAFNGPCDNFLVSNGGSYRLPNGYWLFIARHDGNVPDNWAVLDSIDNHILDLGRWSWKSQALVFVPDNIHRPSASLGSAKITEAEAPKSTTDEDARRKIIAAQAAKRAAAEKVGQSADYKRRIDEARELYKRALELYKAGRYSEAIPLMQRSLAAREKALGPNHPEVADSLNNLALLYDDQGRYGDAEPLYKRSLAIREKALGPDHPDVAESLNNLAGLYKAQGRYADAEPLYKRSLAIRERTLGSDHPDVAESLNNLAVLYDAQRHYADAEHLYKRSLAIWEKALGPDHPNVAGSLHNLARLYKAQGRYADAEPLYERSLAIREKALGPDHPDVAASLNNLAALYDTKGRYADAELLCKRALAIREKALGPDHPDVANSLQNLASIYQGQGRYADAEPLEKRALAIREKAFGPNHLAVANSLNSLASLYLRQERYPDVEALYRRALEIRENALGPNHPDVADSLNNLAALYQDQETPRYADAELLYKRALAIEEQALSPNKLHIAQTLVNLSEIYGAQGRYTDAEPLSKRSLAIRENLLGSNHPDVAQSLGDLAEIYQGQGRYAEAEPLYRRSLQIREKITGPDNVEVARVLNNLASLYHDHGRYANAEPLYKRSLAIREKVLNSNHPDVAESLNNLCRLYLDQGRYADALPIVQRTISQNATRKPVDFAILHGSQSENLISPAQALDASYIVLQHSASRQLAKLYQNLRRVLALAITNSRSLYGKDQDLTAEADGLDKSIIAAVSKPPAERNASVEDRIRKRINEIKVERDKLQDLLNQRFPDYVALSKPQPLSVEQTQALLADDEALVVFDFDAKSYAWVITKADANWTELKIASKDLDAQIKVLRQWLTSHDFKPFDAELSYKLYQSTFGAIGDKIGSKTRLSFITNGALTSLPPQVLITSDPTGKTFKDQDWLVRTYAITVLPTVASLQILRQTSATSAAQKPIIAFADPLFSKQARVDATKQVSIRGITSFYNGAQIDVATIGEHLPQLPGTRREVEAIAKALKADPSDIKLGLNATETAVKQGKSHPISYCVFRNPRSCFGRLRAVR